MRIGLIDYGAGNLGSVRRALEELEVSIQLLREPEETRLAQIDGYILPGVGHFADCAAQLRELGWMQAIPEQIEHGKALLGICVGMQMLATSSHESHEDAPAAGLNLIPGEVRHLQQWACPNRVPHVGWNAVARRAADEPLLAKIPDDTDFYFTHSYAFACKDESDVAAQCDYGVPVTAAVRRGRVWGTQFHPEKSSRAGLRLLRNFVEAGAAC